MKMDWKRTLKLGQTEVLGLDIGSSAVKLVQLARDEAGYTVTAAGIADIAADGEDNNNHRKTNTVRAIGDCLLSAGAQTHFAVCSVSGPEVAVRDFTFPSLPPEEIAGAVLLEAAQVCPFNVDDSVVDYQLIPDGDNETRGVLVAATNELIKNKIELAREASLDCVLMDVNGLALLNCFSECEPPGPYRTATAILNVGGSSTNLAITSSNALPFVRDMAYAGNDMLAQIASENGITTEQAWELIRGGEDWPVAQSDFDEPSRAEPGGSLERACQKLIADVTETLRYYTAHEKSVIVEKIFVCGGFTLVKGFVELLDSRLPAKASIWNPFDKIRCAAGRPTSASSVEPCKDILQKNGPAMAVAAGLAMRTI